MPEEWQPAWQMESLPPETPREAIGGWLLFFCISLTIIAPLTWLGRIARSAQLYWTVTYGVMLIFMICAGVATWMRSDSAFTLLRLLFVSRLVYVAMQIHFGFKLQSLGRSPETVTKEFMSAATNAFNVVLWFWYFKVSTRVERTFGRNI
ncbi:hypothetical protein [Granulicella aggregans]|jgi:hypothetical protein|uniref:hypothetical protein n=1 Tax=Granulicella aggregans TaxID=474949 RepID=UPI0021E00991|nr:hypothetical protein [Granulicella aggregans]